MRDPRREARGAKHEMRAARSGLMVALAAAAIVTTTGQQQPPAQRAQGTVQAGVSAGLVDVVVRDRRGDVVKDLKQSEVQITEDGVPQAIASFAPVINGIVSTPGGATETAPAAAPIASRSVVGAAAAVEAGPTVTALVFDHLSPEGRTLAVLAAQGYLGSRAEAPGYIGVFGIDLAMSPFAPFTRNTRILKQSLDRMGQRSSTTLNSVEAREKAVKLEQAAGAAAATSAAAEASAGAGGSSVGTGTGDAMLAQMQANMIRGFDALDREQSGYSTVNGLFAIIEQMRRLPGRKSIVLFSEGIALPPAVRRQFDGVTDAANRANVSIYTMDAKGLRAESDQALIRDQVNAMGHGGAGILGGGKVGGGALSQSLEYNEDVLRQDPRNALGLLAKDTGGFAFDSTNNLRQGFDRIETDLRNYYLIGYSPTNEKYDGRFRTIDVKVTRPGVTVAARRGYFAVRDPGGAPVNSWEAAALGALESKPVPNAFPLRATALLFPERDRPGLVPVVVQFRTTPMSFTPAADGKTYGSDFAVLVRFIDGQNQVVKKVSGYYDTQGNIADVERAKAGEIIFYREPELPPGVYTMEAIVYDNPTGKASVRFTTVEVPKADASAMRMSTLVLIARAEKVPEKD